MTQQDARVAGRAVYSVGEALRVREAVRAHLSHPQGIQTSKDEK